MPTAKVIQLAIIGRVLEDINRSTTPANTGGARPKTISSVRRR